MNKTEAESIADMLDYTRQLTKWYISKVPSHLLNKSLTIDGHPMNSAYWLIAHLAWAQYSISRSIDAPHADNDWLAEFRISSPHTEHQEHWPALDELLGIMKGIHETTLTFVRTLSTETLDEVHPNEAVHYIFKTKRQALYHINRHEGYHTGQIGLIARVGGATTA